MMLSCIAAVAIATVVGKKTFESHAYETSSLLMQNVEALSDPNDDGYYHVQSRDTKDCTYTLYIGVGGKLKISIVGVGLVTLNADANGNVSYTYASGEVICSGEGSVLCKPQNCPPAPWNS